MAAVTTVIPVTAVAALSVFTAVAAAPTVDGVATVPAFTVVVIQISIFKLQKARRKLAYDLSPPRHVSFLPCSMIAQRLGSGRAYSITDQDSVLFR